ncbi:hypothetical protein BXZ70DRAFT_612206 [Cristinia sonorae]|uniref:Complex 1 LYR protein domain-containing protein n=1 Tax=Cristinia sonorae TaxID=1940300 RepID=A0A8K0XT36_9AGAR|nr:hypothetical protein BXZ70DRAFT_612206 [Cristinia sonorae]
MTSIFKVSEASRAHRAQIAELITSRRRIRPRTPFWNLRIHRVPTLWSLYRGLLRTSPTEDIRWRIRRVFERYRNLTSPTAVREQLLKYHRWLDVFTKAKQGDIHLQAVLARYSKMIVAKREKEDFKHMMREELSWQRKLAHRPVLTGGYLRATVANPPLPRMRPQPDHISGMIHKRRQASTRQWESLGEADIMLQDLKLEAEFEKSLAGAARREGVKFDPVFGDDIGAWRRPISDLKTANWQRIDEGNRRREMPYTTEMLAQIKQARREKVANKTRELQREAHGEVLRRTIFRRRAGPPAHVLAKMTPVQKHMDKVSRSSVSEVGYVGMVKKKLGWKLRNPEAWKVENGPLEKKQYMDAMAAMVRKENARKRREDIDDVEE